jgi:hypothetical protein
MTCSSRGRERAGSDSWGRLAASSWLRILALASCACSAVAGDLFVATGGDDATADGSMGLPFASLAAACSAAAPGDVVQVRGGTYQFAAEERLRPVGTVDAPIRIQPYEGESVVLDGSLAGLAADKYVVRFSSSARHAVLSGFEIANSTGRGLGVGGSENVALVNNRIHDVAGRGIGVRGTSVLVEGNEVWRCALSNEGGGASGGWPGAIQTAHLSGQPSTDLAFRGNRIHDNWGEGLIVGFVDGAVVEDNVLHDNYSQHVYLDRSRQVLVQRNVVFTTTDLYDRDLGGLSRPANCIGMAAEEYVGAPEQGPEAISIVNNLCVGTGVGVRYWHEESNTLPSNTYRDILIAHNVVVRPVSYLIDFSEVDAAHPAPSGVEIRNNIFESTEGGRDLQVGNPGALSFSANDWVNGIPALAQEPASISADPRFEDGSDGSVPEGFQLAAGSPCRGAGTPLAAVGADFWGAARSATAPSIGIHEPLDRPEPQEASPDGDLRVTRDALGEVSVSYEPACGATGHVVRGGALDELARPAAAWTWSECGFDASGTLVLGLPEGTSLYFIVAGHDGEREGSYGRASSGLERPGAGPAASACPLPQVLDGSCP